MDAGLKQWKLIQALLVMGALLVIGIGVRTGFVEPREWVPFLPASPTPDTLVFHLTGMRAALQRRAYPTALDEAERTLARDPANPEAHRGRALALLQLRRWSEATRAFQKLIDQDATDIHARLGLASALANQGETEKAHTLLKRIAIDPLATAEQQGAARAYINELDPLREILDTVPTPQPHRVTPAPLPTPLPLPKVIVDKNGERRLDVPQGRPIMSHDLLDASGSRPTRLRTARPPQR